MTTPLTEDDLLGQVIDLARLHGWRVSHFRPAWSTRGWRTPVQGDTGFPDLIMARNGRVIVAELKGSAGRLRPEQTAWLDALRGEAVEVYVWRPQDWPAIVRSLRRR